MPSPVAYATVKPSIVVPDASTCTPLLLPEALMIGFPMPSSANGFDAGTTTSSA